MDLVRKGLWSLLLLALMGCGQKAVPTATTEATATAVPPEPFRVIGYVTEAVIIDLVPFDKVTHINYAFALPNVDGSLKPMANGWKIDDLVEKAHAHDVQVLISVGGWGHDDTFEQLAADPAARARLVQALVDLVEKHNFDGVDMDWEYPDPVSESPDSAQNNVLLMQALGAEMRARNKLLTAAVVALGYYGAGVDTAVFDEVDFLNVMAYDQGDENHSPLSYAEQAIAYWQGRGLPKEKLVLGVPFYGRPQHVPYNKLVAANAEAPFVDEVEYLGILVNYNGIPTMQAKTELALAEASGIMIWLLANDTQDETSLLLAIHNQIHK